MVRFWFNAIGATLLFLFVIGLGAAGIVALSKPEVAEGVQAQEAPLVDISRYEIWVPTDSSFICNKRGECAWIPPGSLLLTPSPRPIPEPKSY